MMKKFGKLLALLTAAAMITTSAAIPVLADDANETAGEAVLETVEIAESEEDESEEAEEAVEEAAEDEDAEAFELFDGETETETDGEEETEENYVAKLGYEFEDDMKESYPDVTDDYYTGYKSFSALADAINNISYSEVDGVPTLTLDDDVELDALKGLVIVSGTVTIDLKGHTLSRNIGTKDDDDTHRYRDDNYLIKVDEGATLNVKDSGTDGKMYNSPFYYYTIPTTGQYTGQRRDQTTTCSTPVTIYNYGTLNVESGTIYAEKNCVIYSSGSSAEVNVTGGAITCAGAYGIEADGGKVNLSGITVTAEGPVWLKSGYTSATITNCILKGTSKYGINAVGGESLTVTGGTISNTGSQAGIQSSAATTTLTNVKVTSTGGVAVTSSSDTCTISGCEITGKRTVGGAVVISSGTATISGVKITNTATTGTLAAGLQVSGGAVTVNNDTEIKCSYKYGVYVNGGSIEIDSATVTGGTYGIYVNNPESVVDGGEDGCVTITGGEVNGGITANEGTVTISGGTINGTLTESSEDGEIIITGGIYTDSNIKNYLSGNYVATENDDETTTYTVQTAEDAIEATTEPAVTYKYNYNASDDDDTTSPTPTPAVTESSIISGTYVGDEYVKAANNKTITDATITKVQRIDVIDNYSYNESTGELSMDIEPYIEYTYNTNSDTGLTTRDKLDLSQVTAYVTIPLPNDVWADGASVAVTHEYTNGSEVLYGIVESNSVTVKTENGFSTWTVATAQAEEIFVGFEETSDDGVYLMYLTSTEGGIYRYLSSEFEFTLTTADSIGYTVAPYSDSTIVNNMTTSTDSSNNKTIYAFNLDDTSPDTNGVSADQEEKIYIATVTFTGIGSFTFSIDENYTDTKVNTAVYNVNDNNIVKTYTLSDGSATTDVLSKDDTYGTISDTLTLDTAYLDIYVYFPNKAEFQSYDYEKMMITIESSALNDPITVELGDYTNASGVAKKGKVDYGSNDELFGFYSSTISEIEPSTTNDYYGYSVFLIIPANYTSTLTFTADGYRTYSTSITPASSIGTYKVNTVTVWNNVMDDAETVISSADNAMGAVTENVTFLAGDIVANDKIDLWDLSAVVSYFGKGDLTTYDDISEVEDFIKYDLNRDGKIDSKDIAMVLVSWDN
ncbi:MAG: hypothetical protein LUF26_07555 [Firmicutes bacterium]|nr:hypothetical protein [Bacillota bacterium]